MLGLARQIDEPAFQRRESRQKIRRASRPAFHPALANAVRSSAALRQTAVLAPVRLDRARTRRPRLPPIRPLLRLRAPSSQASNAFSADRVTLSLSFSRHYLKPRAPYVSRTYKGASFCLSVGVGLARNPSHGAGDRLYSQMNARDVLASTSLERRLMPNGNRQ